MTPQLVTARLRLEPLRPAHALEMAPLLDDPALHTFIGGAPSTVDELRARYARQVSGDPGWHNWVLRLLAERSPIGTVQATVTDDTAELAWVIATAHQGKGYATESARAVADWLRANGIIEIHAHIHPGHAASAGVASALGMSPTDTAVDGETRWSAHPQ